MLLFVNYTLLDYFKDGKATIYNLSSPIEYGIRLHSLVPVFSLWKDKESKEFDINYAESLLNDNNCFINIMRMMTKVYNGNNVVVLVGRDDSSVFITESLLKFIQQRYGYNGCILNDLNDVFYAQESDFSVNGLYNLDIDVQRYMNIEDPAYLLKYFRDNIPEFDRDELERAINGGGA